MATQRKRKQRSIKNRHANPSRWVKDWLQKGIEPNKSDEIAYKERVFLLLAGCSVLGLAIASNVLNRVIYWHEENPEMAKFRDELTDKEMAEWDRSGDIPGNYEYFLSSYDIKLFKEQNRPKTGKKGKK